MTPTPTQTPSVTPIVCTSGTTSVNAWYYTDCCGNLITGSGVTTVVFNNLLPKNGVTSLNVPVTIVCPSPTPTPSPTVTPTNTLTPSNTPTFTPTSTLTPTPTLTPSRTPVYTYQNECEPFTLFDMGIQCYVVKEPTSSTSFDGSLSVIVTGGTGPYSFLWSSGDRNQTLNNIGAGTYIVQVVDYYGDYTATTVCTLAAPSPTPTNTPTFTPTPTSTFAPPNLCFVLYAGNTTTGPLQFVTSGATNGRQSWYNSSDDIFVIWNSTISRWEFSGWTGSGLPVSLTQNLIPTSGWLFAGNVPQPSSISLTTGTCPPYAPFVINAVPSDSTCNGQINCDGNITVNTQGGVPPYQFSIDGVNFQNGNIFNGLCPGTITVTAQDNTGNTQTQSVVINSGNNYQTYTVSVVIDQVQSVNQNTQIASWHVDIQPPLPYGPAVSFNLAVNVDQQAQGPFYLNDPLATMTILESVVVTKNGTPQVLTIGPTNNQTLNRPGCAPSTISQSTFTGTLSLTMVSGDTVSGVTTSSIFVNNPVVVNSCVSTGVQSILTSIINPEIVGGSCVGVITDGIQQGINDHTVVGI